MTTLEERSDCTVSSLDASNTEDTVLSSNEECCKENEEVDNSTASRNRNEGDKTNNHAENLADHLQSNLHFDQPITTLSISSLEEHDKASSEMSSWLCNFFGNSDHSAAAAVEGNSSRPMNEHFLSSLRSSKNRRTNAVVTFGNITVVKYETMPANYAKSVSDPGRNQMNEQTLNLDEYEVLRTKRNCTRRLQLNIRRTVPYFVLEDKFLRDNGFSDKDILACSRAASCTRKRASKQQRQKRKSLLNKSGHEQRKLQGATTNQ